MDDSSRLRPSDPRPGPDPDSTDGNPNPYGVMLPKFGTVREPAAADHDGPFIEDENLWETTPPKRNMLVTTPTPPSSSPSSQNLLDYLGDLVSPFPNAASLRPSSSFYAHPFVPKFGSDGDESRMQMLLKASAKEAEANANEEDESTDFGQNSSNRKSQLLLSTAPSASLSSRPKWMVQSSGLLDDAVAILSPEPHVPIISSLETRLQDDSSTPQGIPLQELKEITNNFSDDRILGRGGFGVVYKGVLPNGHTIAVKRIVTSLMPGQQKQFESEVYHLMMLRHPHVVRCVGYCYEIQNACLEFNGKYVFAETAERLLCMEYMPKGSLDKYLSDESSGLDWSTRYNIIEGICHGLCHLHVQMNKPILHLDLKPANILLDDGMVPKITDFGLSRLLDQQQTVCTSSRDGTFGYMAPEFLHGGTITPKSDIFSLGVIILEVVTGHRDYPDVTTTPSDDFTELTIRKWRDVLERSPGYRSLETDCEQIKRCIQVGLTCVNSDRTKRPPIAKVISMLQGSE